MNLNKGYNLGIRGERVKELLSRHFVVPTLQHAPTTTTLSWEDGNYTVPFRVGEMCRVEENNTWIFYRLDNINTKGEALWTSTIQQEILEKDNYYTKQEVESKLNAIQEIINEIKASNTSEGIDSLEEVQKFLEGMKDTETLQEKLDNLESGDGEITPTYDESSGKLTLS